MPIAMKLLYLAVPIYVNVADRPILAALLFYVLSNILVPLRLCLPAGANLQPICAILMLSGFQGLGGPNVIMPRLNGKMA